MTHTAIVDLTTALQVADPSDAAQVADADTRAGAMLHIAIAFIQKRLGQDEAARLVRKAFDDVAEAVGPQPSAPDASPEPVAIPAAAKPMMNATMPTLQPGPRRPPSSSVQGRAETMLDVLKTWEPADAEREAHAAIWGSAVFLHHHLGEEKTASYLRTILGQMSLLAWFEQLPVASLTKH